MEDAARRTIELVRKHPAKFQTITADNGTEFHSYKDVGHRRLQCDRSQAELPTQKKV
jgi:IS30 family transposase